MARQFYEFRIKARQRWNRRMPKDRRTTRHFVVARSRHDAKMVFQDHFPKLVVLECTRGAPVAAPKTSNPHWSRGRLLTPPRK